MERSSDRLEPRNECKRERPDEQIVGAYMQCQHLCGLRPESQKSTRDGIIVTRHMVVEWVHITNVHIVGELLPVLKIVITTS